MSYLIKIICFVFFISCASQAPRFAPLGNSEKFEDHYAKYDKFAVASAGKNSSRIARDIYAKSKNVVDAAVALSFAISVERPHSTGLAGGGFMLLKLKDWKAPKAFDFREMAPSAAHAKMYLDLDGKAIPNLSLDGVKAVAVPGLVAGVVEIHKQYGKLPLAEILAPVIELAENGFPVYPALHRAITERQEILKKYDRDKIFFDKNDKPLAVGSVLKQPALAKTLKLIALKGKAGFYEGEVARAIVEKMQSFNGLLTLNDLRNYKMKERKPIETEYMKKKIYSMPLPSSGGIHLAQMLNILKNDDLRTMGLQSPESVHLISSAMQIAYADRATYLGDSDFVKVPVEKITSKQYADSLRKIIPADKAMDSKEFPKPALMDGKKESDETTHFSLMDDEGNAVASTQTINWLFGSGVIIADYGLVLNDEMDDFTVEVGAQNAFGLVGGKNNAIAANKRPLSSMTPTLVMDKKNRVELAVGSPAGSRIITCVLNTILNHYAYGLPLYEAVSGARFHHQWQPNVIMMDPPYLPGETQAALKKMGHELKEMPFYCQVEAVGQGGDGKLEAVADPRDYGQVHGL